MCRTCGCDEVHHHPHGAYAEQRGFIDRSKIVSVESDLLAKNDRLARALRDRFARDRIVVLNLIGTPGAGKTTLLEHTIRTLGSVRLSVLEGDQATDRDAKRIAATGCSVTQINTGAGCHLDASMIERGLALLSPPADSTLLVENVGNLVCPALFDLGERAKVVVMSITEGVDKPLKYPHAFRAATAMVLTKMDLAPHLDVDPTELVANARQINPMLNVFPVSATRGLGIAEWCGWIRQLGARA
jgi:hydrogenase nickel incorporation protein HypB